MADETGNDERAEHDIVDRLRAHLARRDFTSRTHWDGCIDSHPICALAWALDEIERLRAEVNGMASAQAGWGKVQRLRAAGDALDEFIARHLPHHGWTTVDRYRASAVRDAWEEARRG